MSIYKRGNFWWMEFQAGGIQIRESTKVPILNKARKETVVNKLEAEKREFARKAEVEASGYQKPKRPKSFAESSHEWLELSKPHWTASNLRIETYNVNHLIPYFGKRLLRNITGDHISQYQAERRHQGASNRTVNMEVGTLRAILRKHRLWANLQPDVRMLKVRQDVGRALTGDEVHRLLAACKKSNSRSLYPAILLSLHTGLRNGELRMLKWRQIDFLAGELTVGVSKTLGGEGRVIPLSATAAQCIQEWRSQFPEAQPDHFVFPSERYGFDGDDGRGDGKPIAYATQPNKPIGSWKVAWTNARAEAKVNMRWHDARHHFFSLLAEGQASDATIMALGGWMSRKMMEKYSHTRSEAKKAAISAMDGASLRQVPTKVPTGVN